MRAEHCFSLEEAYALIQMEGEDVMTTTDEKAAPGAQPVELDNPALEELLRAAQRYAFGPTFFVEQLNAFVRDRCPDPAEGLPTVDLRLCSGEDVSVCHIVAVGPRWVAVAALESDSSHGRHAMHTELIPYELIARVTIGAKTTRGHSIGFEDRPPEIVGDQPRPEDALRAAAGQGPHA